jgi:predicted glycogen debranching enzyme
MWLQDAPMKSSAASGAASQSELYQPVLNATEGCLYDCISEGGSDGACPPNQILVVRCRTALLTSELEKRVVATVQRELLTPYGLRSLSPQDPQYRGIYIGDQWQRDGSYHQGTVWGWLIGPFLSAYLK